MCARLEYSAYDADGGSECARIVAEAERAGRCGVALRHRIGALGSAMSRWPSRWRRPTATRLRGLPPRDRRGEAPGADLEAGVLRGRDGGTGWIRRAGRASSVGAMIARPRSPSSLTARRPLGRPLGSLRLSVTDRCNMRCRYCMPEENTSGCRGSRSSPSRRSIGWPGSLPGSASQDPAHRRRAAAASRSRRRWSRMLARHPSARAISR